MEVLPEQCWTLVRVPMSMEPGPAFLLRNDMNKIKIGRRKRGTNDKVCNGAHVSREHLELVRSGKDWQTIRWNVKDLGGMGGTFVNTVKMDAQSQTALNCGDLIGLGCNSRMSTINISDQDDIESFVYMVKSPEALRVLPAPILVDAREQDATPPPVYIQNEEGIKESGNLPDVIVSNKPSLARGLKTSVGKDKIGRAHV